MDYIAWKDKEHDAPETPDDFLVKFKELYQSTGQFRNSVVVGLAKAIVARHSGHLNAPAPGKVIAFLNILHAKSPKAYGIVKNNIFGYSRRHIARLSARYRGDNLILEISREKMTERICPWVKELWKSVQDTENPFVLVSIGVDATRVFKTFAPATSFKKILGKPFPNHIIAYETDDEMRAMLQSEDNITDNLAPEVKVALVTAQTSRDGISPIRVLGARPQTKNEECLEFNEDVLKSMGNIRECKVVSIAFDGLSAESSTVNDHLLAFLLGDDLTVGVMDPNHAAKSFRSQLVLGSSIVQLGNDFVFDVGLLNEAGVQKSLFVVDDFASDNLVLQLCSPKTIEKLLECDSSESNNVCFMIMTLFFLRVFLISVNSETIPRMTRLRLLWMSLQFLTSLEGIHETTRQNFAKSAIATMCLVAQNNISKIRLCTSEPNEHFFGNMRCHIREFTLVDLVYYASKLEKVFCDMTTYDLKSNTSKSGYMHGFAGFASALQKLVDTCQNSQNLNSSTVGTPHEKLLNAVDVNYLAEESVASQIEKVIVQSGNWATNHMISILRSFKVKDTRSVFVQKFYTLHGIAQCLFSTLPETYRVKSKYRDVLRSATIGCWQECSTAVEELDEECDIEESEEDMDALFSAVANLQVESTCVSTVQDLGNFFRDRYADELNTGRTINYVSLDHCVLGTLVLQRTPAELACTSFQVLQSYTTNREGRGRADIEAKVKSLQARWFGNVSGNTTDSDEDIKRGQIIFLNNTNYLIYAVFKLSYRKWRWVISSTWNEREKCIVHARPVEIFSGTVLELTSAPPILLNGKQMKKATRSSYGYLTASQRC